MQNDNHIYLLDEPARPFNQNINGLNVKWGGEGNTLFIGKNYTDILQGKFAINVQFMGSNSKVILRDTYFHQYIDIMMLSNSTLTIGQNNLFWSLKIHIFGKNVTIGNDNLFAEGVQILPSDGHTIRDRFTGKILNEARDVIIGNNNWVCRQSVFLKGSGLANNSVVGFNSLVTRYFTESNILIAGQPAVMRRNNIEWER